MKQTVLNAWHRAHDACLAEFAGWELPLYYASGAVKEHEACRQSAALFDICHMGRFLVSGAKGLAWLGSRLSRRMDDLAPGHARYAFLLNEAGGIEDDLLVYRLDQGHALVVVNAVRRQEDLAALLAALPGDGSAGLRDVSEQYGMLALQGPRALEIAASLLHLAEDPRSPAEHHGQAPLSGLPRRRIARARADALPCLVARTGYSGEDGLEIICPQEAAPGLWQDLLDAAGRLGIPCLPAGLAARDSLRFESGLPLLGHELGPETNPFEAGLGWACDFGHDYPGRSALEAASGAVQRRLATITVQGGVPRAGCAIHAASGPDAPPDGQAIATVLSGLYCPSVKAYACTALLPAALALPGTSVTVLVRERRLPGQVVNHPLHPPIDRRLAEAARAAASGPSRITQI